MTGDGQPARLELLGGRLLGVPFISAGLAIVYLVNVVRPNKGMEPITYSLRFAAASGNGSCLALSL